MEMLVNKRNNSKSNRRDLFFCILLLLWPTLQFSIFYIGVNFNSFLMMFQRYDGDVGGFVTSGENFVQNLKIIGGWFVEDGHIAKGFGNALTMSLLCWGTTLLIGMPLGLFFSYFIFKKYKGSSFFRIILYLPSIISGLILMVIFKYFVNDTLSQWLNVDPIIYNSDYHVRRLLIIGFNLWFSFGISCLMYSNAMSEISPEIIESAQLDGCKGFKEFWHICVPMVWPTISVFLVNSLATIFVNQANILSLYGTDAMEEIQTIGYYMFVMVKKGKDQYPTMALLGIMFSLVAIPLTLGIRKLLEKVGPSMR